MKDFGEYLRQERISRGVTLEAIENRTRIRMQHLKAIENGQFDRLPEATYIKAFLRHYAKSVGLNEREVLQRYEALAGVDETDSSQILRESRSERRARQFKARRRRRAFQWIGVMAVILLMVASRWWGEPWGQTESPETLPATTVRAPTEQGTPSEQANPIAPQNGAAKGPVVKNSTPNDDLSSSLQASQAHHDTSANNSEAPTGLAVRSEPASDGRQRHGTEDHAVQPATASVQLDTYEQFRQRLVIPGKGPLVVPLADPNAGFDMSLEATGRSWAELWIDGERALYRNLEAEERVSFHVTSTASLRLGRAEDVVLKIGDIYVGTVGTGVVDKEFTTQSRDE